MTALRTLLCFATVTMVALALGGCPPKPEPPPITNAPAPGPAALEDVVIGFSQCTTAEPWRVLFDDLLIKEADQHPEVTLIVQDAQDRTSTQEEQTRSFITQGVDAILISPKESAGLTGVVEDATAAGIPVIVLDRDVDTENYAAFVGGDNTEIGREAGTYAVEVLGGEGQAKGIIYEIWGGMGSTPARERHGGFAEIVEQEPGIELIGEQDGDWKKEKGIDIMETALKAHDHIDIVYAHNDPMAYGAYLAAEEAGRAEEIKFIGIDAIPGEGCQWVKQGKLAATFVYPPPGVKGLQVALDILAGNPPPEKRIMLPTRRITKETVDEYLREQGISPVGE
ncbi:MAG: substrate-binding domain-containing protein [Armatimonadota bacterium]